MGIVFGEEGDFLFAMSAYSVQHLKSNKNNNKVEDNKFFIIDPEKKTLFTKNWEKRAIDKFNLYFTRIFKDNSPFVDSKILFGNHIRNSINKYYSNNGIILDLGSGSAKYTNSFNRLSSKVVAYDLSFDKNKKTNSSKTSKAINVNGNARNLPFKKSSFSLILCNFLLEHVPNTFEIINQIQYVLKDKGKIIISIPSLNLHEIINVFLLRKKLTLPIHHLRSFAIFSYKFCESIPNLIRYLKRNNLSILKVEAISPLEPKNLFSTFINKRFRSVFPFKYLGSQIIIVAEKNGNPNN